MNLQDLKYHKGHEWVRLGPDAVASIGITDFAQQQLGEIVYVELPKVGDALTIAQAYGEVESVKSVSELFAPVSGRIVEVNAALTDSPETINVDPYGNGWIAKVAITDISEVDSLMDSSEYLRYSEGK